MGEEDDIIKDYDDFSEDATFPLSPEKE